MEKIYCSLIVKDGFIVRECYGGGFTKSTKGNIFSVVIVIEHDVVVLSNCNWIIEIGPGADSDGGEVIAEGTPYALKNNEKSKIGKYIL